MYFRVSFFVAALIVSSPGLGVAEPAEPTAANVLAQLFHHSELKTDSLPSCKDQYRNMHEKDRTLGRYLAEKIAPLEDEGDNVLRYSCDPEKGGGWRCSLEFQHNVPGKEITTMYGVRVAVDRNGVVQTKGLECTGLP